MRAEVVLERRATGSLVVIADELRRRAGELEPPYSTTAIITACFPEVVVTGRALPEGIDELVTRGLIIYKRGLSGPEQRYAIAHAIGHLLFDLDVEADAAGVGFRGNPRTELRADDFGAELLVPLSVLTRHVQRWPTPSSTQIDTQEAYFDQVDQISAKFNVPQGLVAERIRKLECLVKVHGEIVLTK